MNKKGRKPGVTNYSEICDDSISPYKIYADESCYVLVKFDEDKEKNIGYFKSFGAVLDRIAKLRTIDDNKQTNISNYIKEYNNNLKTFYKIFEKWIDN